jgi:hypothetical protein
MRSTHLPGRPPLESCRAELLQSCKPRYGQQQHSRLFKTLAPNSAAAAVIQHLETAAEAHRKRRAGPSALDPVLAKETPLKRTKSNYYKKKSMSLLKLSALAVMSHPFGIELASWEKEVAVDCGPEWSLEAINMAVEQGPHPTTRAAGDVVALVHENIAYQVKAGFTEVVYWDEIKDRLPAHFKVSPVAVIPQTGRRGRIILDLSFPVLRPPQNKSTRCMGEVVQESINDTTKRRGRATRAPLGKDSEVRTALLDLKHLILSLASRPTHVSELVEYEPDLAGTCDASSAGAGDIWIGYRAQAAVWRLEWPTDIVELYKQGTLMNSDLVMAAVLLQYLVAEQLRPLDQYHTAIWSDLAAKATTPIAGQLLRALAMRQHTRCAALPTVAHYAGSCNIPADTASCSFSQFHHGCKRGHPSHSDDRFLTSFNTVFSLSLFSKMQSWRLVP